MPLPTCQCVNGLPIQDQLAAIYCALFEISGGSVGAPILGEMRHLTGSAVPAGWLAADGAAVSRATYADYFALVGITYGAGNGSTTFNLPDARARAVVSPDAGANRLTGAAAGGCGGSAGDSGGSETVSLTSNELGTASLSAGAAVGAGADFDNNVTLNGDGTPANIVQPTLVVGNAIVYVGV